MGNFSKAILIASVALCLHISAFSQGISLKNKEISVKEAMELLKEKSGYSFVFSSADVNTNKRISISTDKATIDDVVKQILQGQNNLTYEIQNKRIIVKKIQPGDKTKNKRIKAVGKVVDDAGEPIIGATVREQGTTNGTVTGIDGSFSLDVADNVNLEISYIGYETRKIRAQQGKKLDITMREDANVLDEIVVLGYGNIRRSDVTGSIASVSSESISKVASASVADALAGKMAGVQITTADGALDAEISVRVRGGGSITQDNSPLFLVDGFPVDDLSGIPPTDIESIDVLKEASMTAIYGARGANGVVIVTTKNPKKGKTTVQFNSYLQMRTLARKIPVMNNYEFVMAEYEYQMIRKGSDEGFIKNFGYYDDIDLYKYTNTTDWQDEILGGNPISQYYNITVNGGNEKTKFNLSYTRNKDEGQLIGSGLTRNNINLKLNHQLFKNLKLETNATYRTRTIDGAGTSGTNIVTALRFRPTNGLSAGVAVDPDDDEENLDGDGNSLNQKYTPVEENKQNYRKRDEQALSLKAALVWDVIKGLQSIRFISDLKLRASYGLAGNNRIGNDLWHNIYRVYSGTSAPAFGNEEYNYYQFADQTYLYDPDLKWETTITRNIGLDFGFFRNRLSGTVDVYWNTTKDLLVPSIIPNSSGYSRQMTNVGQTSNKGVEISLDAKIIQTKDFQLSANFNVAFNKNKVDKLATGETEWKTKASLSNWYGTYNYKMEVGKSMGLIYGFVNDGFYKVDDFDFDATTKKWTLKPGIPDNSSFSSGNFAFKPGAMKFKKLSDSESNLITEDDMTVIGDTNPKVTGGFGLSGNWKNLDFTAFFNYMCDFDVLNVNKLYLHSAVRRNYSNLSTDMNLANRFRYVDDAGVNVSSDPVALAALNENAKTYSWMSVTQGITMTDLVEDGSFLRLSTLTVGYTLPKHWLRSLGVKSLRLYFSGSNLFTITGYSGYDPEVNIQKGLTPGIDNNVTPRSRVYTVGVNLNF